MKIIDRYFFNRDKKYRLSCLLYMESKETDHDAIEIETRSKMKYSETKPIGTIHSDSKRSVISDSKGTKDHESEEKIIIMYYRGNRSIETEFLARWSFREDSHIGIPTEIEWSKMSKNLVEKKNGCILIKRERITFRKNRYLSNRVFYDWFVGDTKSYCIVSSCGMKACVSPSHLIVGRKTDHKLQIRKMITDPSDSTQSERSKQFDISISAIKKFDSGLSYKNLRDHPSNVQKKRTST